MASIKIAAAVRLCELEVIYAEIKIERYGGPVDPENERTKENASHVYLLRCTLCAASLVIVNVY